MPDACLRASPTVWQSVAREAQDEVMYHLLVSWNKVKHALQINLINVIKLKSAQLAQFLRSEGFGVRPFLSTCEM